MTKTRSTAASRRVFLMFAGAGGGALALAGCGFKLREAPVFAFSTIAVPGKSAYVNQLRRALTTTGPLTGESDPQVPPEVVFDLLGEPRGRAVLSSTAEHVLGMPRSY